jgi:hypothetical protein
MERIAEASEMHQLLFQITIVANTTKKQLQLFVSQPLPIHLFPYSIALPYLNTPGAGNTLAFPNLSLSE